jgi:hypothetical protein
MDTSKWFYGEYGKRYEGPVTSERMKSMLRTGELPTDALVWRAGFDCWQPLSDVAESIVAGAEESAPDGAPEPPPLPGTPEHAALFASEGPGGQGVPRDTAPPIGGWLILPAIGFVAGPVLTVLVAVGAYSASEMSFHVWRFFAVFAACEIYVTRLFFLRKRKAPEFVVLLLAAASALWIAVAFVSGSFTWPDQPIILGPVILAAVSIAYFVFSKRVKKTFVAP